ncbi:calcium-binding and coiled-coil domain-containing protein 2 isoform X2 [Esox lucius]|uniref:SKICH domain-containing protein n=1 Tax=Esox lucius TaxID=8010 RepID=A0A3P8XUL5_ESOLU|nr:calcium-binding and coiled-coil domain-containing protein 2 isoform X2 [Esox lucius]
MEVSTTFAQVVFQNIPHSYTPNVPVTCCYTLTSAIQPNPRDWVGIFKVGWSNTKDYHTFVWVEPSVGLEGQEPVMKQVIFTTYYLPKDDAEFYQFCYVDSTGLVRGASTPFCFKTPEEQSTDSLENDLLIITTQEKVDQREREQEELVRELRQQTELNETLRSTLKEQQQEIHRLKLSNEGSYQANWNLEKHPQNARDLVKLTQNSKPMGASSKGLEDNVEKGERERAELAMELQQLKEQNEALKCALMEQQSKVCCLKENVEKNEREKAELVMELKEQKEQNQTLTSALQEQQDKVDLQSTEKEKLSTELRGMGSLTHNLEDLKTENKALRRSLSEQGQQHHLPDEKVDSEMKKYKAYISQLHEANTKLQQERQASIHIRKWAEHAEAELKELKEQKEQNQTLTSALQEQQDKSMTTSSEKYDQALTKIKQLKSERGELKRKVEELSEEIAQLSPRLRESEQESSRLKDHIQLLQVDLQSTEKEKEKLSTELRGMGSLTHNLEDLKTENKALRRSLSEQGQQHHLPDEKVDSEMKKYQAYISQLHEANTKLQQERQASIHIRKWAEHAEAELKELKEQMESTVKASTQMKMKNSKLEMKLTELHGIIQEKENMTEMAEVEKVELSRENQDLKRDIEKLRREVADLQAAQVSAHYSNPYSSSTDPNPTAVQHQDTQANTLYFGNPYETPGTATNPHQDELSLECRHCHECFPGITQDELEQHELSHRVCPFCTLICDNMEQTSYEDHVYSHEV